MEDIFETEFKVTPNNLVNGVTWGIGILFLCMGAIIPYFTYQYEKDEKFLWLYLLILFSLIFGLTYIGAWLYSPQTYFVSDKNIRIQRPVKPIIIPFTEINMVETTDINPLKTIRKWGNGGIFSIMGLFHSKKDGDFWVYAKNNNYIMIHADKKYVVSPDDKELFIQYVQSKIDRQKK
jgi:hypothetical protein